MLFPYHNNFFNSQTLTVPANQLCTLIQEKHQKKKIVIKIIVESRTSKLILATNSVREYQ